LEKIAYLTVALLLFLISCVKNTDRAYRDAGIVSNDAVLITKLHLSRVIAPLSYNTFPLVNLTDGNLATIWSVTATNSPIVTFKLDTVQTVSYIKIGFFTGDKTIIYNFDIQVSKDSLNWTMVAANQKSTLNKTATNTPPLQTFDFPDAPGKFVRIIGHGNNTHAYPGTNSYTEAEIYGSAITVVPPVVESFYAANDPRIQYVGRIDFKNPLLPRFWQPGIYITTAFNGTGCSVILNDEAYSTTNNYISYIIDNGLPVRIRLWAKRKGNASFATDTVVVAKGLTPGIHSVRICKELESGLGFLELVGFRTTSLQQPAALPLKKIEFFGDSQTLGYGADASAIPCGTAFWYDEHDAYNSYGPVTARALNAQWVLSASGGVGMVRSVSNGYLMPQVYDKMSMWNNTMPYDMSKWIPDVVTICIGQNDLTPDSTLFCNAYIKFVNTIKSKYPAAKIVVLTSPMAVPELSAVIQKNLKSVVAKINTTSAQPVYYYNFSKRYYHGCGAHPTVAEHQQIAAELTTFIKNALNWKV
jgi:lysophospholipase L1-like esterase